MPRSAGEPAELTGSRVKGIRKCQRAGYRFSDRLPSESFQAVLACGHSSRTGSQGALLLLGICPYLPIVMVQAPRQYSLPALFLRSPVCALSQVPLPFFVSSHQMYRTGELPAVADAFKRKFKEKIQNLRNEMLKTFVFSHTLCYNPKMTVSASAGSPDTGD